jgi:hypothetical protein
MEPLNVNNSASRSNLSSRTKWAAKCLVSLTKKSAIQDFVVPIQSDIRVEGYVRHEELVKLSEE